MKAIIHPCFECTLPDCDDASLKCALRRALNLKHSLYAKGVKPDDVLRAKANIAYMEFYGQAHNERRRAKKMGSPA